MFARLKSTRGRFLSLLVLAYVTCLSTLPFARSKRSLDPVGIYGSIAHAEECLSITWNIANQRVRGATIPNCLRFAFHDAATYQTDRDNGDGNEGGANGSIMRELDFSIFTQHNGLQQCGIAMQAVLDDARSLAGGCPQLTAADAIQVVGAAAVAAAGGPVCNMLMGRRDKQGSDDISVLPSICSNADTLIAGFARNGFTNPAESLVVLSGAHNIGSSRVTGRSQCSRGQGPLTANANNFDGHYYNEVVDNTGRQGWFTSDRTLAQDSDTAGLMTTYARNHSAFLGAWCQHYSESSLLGVDTSVVAQLGIPSDGWKPTISSGGGGGGGAGGGGNGGGGSGPGGGGGGPGGAGGGPGGGGGGRR